MNPTFRIVAFATAAATLPGIAPRVTAQTPQPAAAPAAPQGQAPRTPNDTLSSPRVLPDGRVLFQLYAPKAAEVTVRSEGPGAYANQRMTRNEQGVWAYTSPVLAPDVYIYWYDVDGVAVVDPRNPVTRVNNTTVRNLVDVPGAGAEFHANRPVPHGAVAQVWYQSSSLGMPRRMHVYTPPGYGVSSDRYPVLYLLHGGGDQDASWSTVGRAGFILDNLLAEGAARPMIVVMPAGHTPVSGSAMSATAEQDPFTGDLLRDIVPYVEANYRTLSGAENRALAGLSMGGVQTLNIGLGNLDRFGHIGVFSSGWFPQVREEWERTNAALLRDPAAHRRLRTFWIATGSGDIALPNTRGMLEMFDRHGLRYTFRETAGGHTWPEWRLHLREFAPLLFR
jgi:enterochelin esterase-like enzyme